MLGIQECPRREGSGGRVWPFTTNSETGVHREACYSPPTVKRVLLVLAFLVQDDSLWRVSVLFPPVSQVIHPLLIPGYQHSSDPGLSTCSRFPGYQRGAGSRVINGSRKAGYQRGAGINREEYPTPRYTPGGIPTPEVHNGRDVHPEVHNGRDVHPEVHPEVHTACYTP